MKKLADYSNQQVYAIVNYKEEGCPLASVQGRYRVLYSFRDPAFGDETMLEISDGNEDDPIFVTASSAIFEKIPVEVPAKAEIIHDGKKLSVFVQDAGVYGNIVVIAKTEEQARELMAKEQNYSKTDPVYRYDIEDGLVIANYGDL